MKAWMLVLIIAILILNCAMSIFYINLNYETACKNIELTHAIETYQWNELLGRWKMITAQQKDEK